MSGEGLNKTEPEALEAELETRKVFRAVFCDTADGGSVLTWLLNECGYFSGDANLINPVMIALCNRLLNKIGIVQEDNLFLDTNARLGIANDRDLQRAIQKRKGEEYGNS
jgi:hypothetical protein